MLTPHQGSNSLRFALLGPVRAWRNDRQIDLGSTRQRAVLARLLLSAGQPRGASEIILAVWGEKLPGNPRNLVHKYVGGLRRALEPGTEISRTSNLLPLGDNGYVLHVDREQVDLNLFTRAAAEGAALVDVDLSAACARLDVALGLWRGEAFGNLPGPYFAAERKRLAEQRTAVAEDRIAIDIVLGRHAKAVTELAGLLRENPLREHLSALLMLALFMSGRQAEALRAFQECRHRLVAELGIEPAREVQEVHRQILAGKPVRRIALSSGQEIEVQGPGVSREKSGRRPRACEGSPTPHRRGEVPQFTLGPDTRDFIGREREASRIGALLSEPAEAPIVVITGMAGVGKSALATRLANLLAHRFPDGRLCLNLRGMTANPLGREAALRRLLQQLGREFEPTATADELEELFRNAIRGRVLTVLDDVADERQVRPLLGGDATLITSRRRLTGLEGAHIVELTPLDVADSMKMLRRIAGPDRTVVGKSEHARRLLECTDGLPLALRIVGARLLARPHWSLGQVLDLLADPERRLAELIHNDLEVRASLAVTFHRLSTRGKEALLRLGAQDRDTFTLPEAAVALGLKEIEAVETVEELVDLRLVRVDEAYTPSRPTYCLRGLTRLFARSEGAGRQRLRVAPPYVPSPRAMTSVGS
ncbi:MULTISPECIES: BTAD domain-containing putative transcriptional regulator [unclassified Streptomyces]|uniref:AfsR/SARP family transcriptional regulator n=1 Tax=unclassified Streptomyces TaxID=2593676 RepID=UPI0033BDBC54